MSDRLRVGVIGTNFGGLVHIPTFQAHPRAEVVAVSSGNLERARAVADKFHIRYAFDDHAALIAAGVDLVAVAAPPYLHRAMVLDATAAGCHVLCEKPMALSAREAEDMIRAARKYAGAAALIDYELRFNPNRRKIKTLVDAGFIGTPRHGLITAVGLIRMMPWNWWSDVERGGGMLGAVASHQIDLLRYWLGEPAAVSGALETFTKARVPPEGGGPRPVSSDDFVVCTLRFASGAIGTVVVGAAAVHARGTRVELWGDGGTLVIDEQERLWGATAGQHFAELTEPDTLTSPPGMQYAAPWGLSFVRLADHVVNAILDDRPLAPAATFEDGLQVRRVMDGLHSASRTGWQSVASARLIEGRDS
jgi:predicted dehydrogenase